MILYGDPQFQATAHAALGWLQQRLAGLSPADRDGVRATLIQAGQLEQAVADADPDRDPDSECLSFHFQVQALTDLLAEAFLHQILSTGSDAASPVVEALGAARKQLTKLQADPNQPGQHLCLKLPEGFEFYALYPEQFVTAAHRWMAEHPTTRADGVLVVGVRGIGTTLSAMVATALRAADWKTSRMTVRPKGHPFARTVELETRVPPEARWALVVDEGPGLSGSSMAAAAEALVRVGIEVERISFFPGHAGEPGHAATGAVRHWWKRIPRYVSASPALEHFQAALIRERSGAVDGELVDLGGGLWREVVYSPSANWPAATMAFERPKFLIRPANAPPELWKFAGLGAWVVPDQTGLEAAVAQLSRLAPDGFVAPPIGVAAGFVGAPWLEGERLKGEDAGQMIEHLGGYLGRAAGTPLPPEEAARSLERLASMLCHNLAETGLSAPANFDRMLGSAARVSQGTPTYGDGRLGPWEWVRTPSGAVFKTDATGHSTDHTCVGQQCVLWDLAGAVVEWNLTSPEWVAMLARSTGLDGRLFDARAIEFYRLAYAAFRLGLVMFCAGLEPSDSLERPRLDSAAAYYRSHLVRGSTLPF